MRLFGGEIGVESEVGDGSQFWFTAELIKQKTEEKKVDGKPLDGLNVFINTENKRVRDVLKEFVKGWHCSVVMPDNSVTKPLADVAILDLSVIVDNGLASHEILKKIIRANYGGVATGSPGQGQQRRGL